MLLGVVNVPYGFVKQQMVHGSNTTSFVAKAVEEAENEKGLGAEQEHAIKWTAASMYTGGADTSVSTMDAFFLATCMFPEVQKKAQEEIDGIVGSARLPTFSDRDSLPYLNAIVEEAQRWHPIAPVGLPHASDEEDYINGFRIPKGALLLPNIWWVTRDPVVYHNPEVFKPERFLPPNNEPSAMNVTFGFGRRVCPGQVLAESNIFLTCAQSLSVFNIKEAVDDQGREIQVKHTFEPGIIARPGAFRVRVTPRSKEHAGLIAKVVEEHPWEESDAKYLESTKV